MAKIEKTEQEWRAELSPEVFEVCRRKGTERAFSGAYWDTKKDGIYHCTCCGEPLFRSEAKYDSGTGWPSFFEPVHPDAVRTESDSTLGMERIEVMCTACDAHLGHVFPDGPKPTGERYCMNSASLRLDETDGEPSS